MEIIDKIEKCGVIPVIQIDSEEDAIPLADSLLEGGLPVAEITFRTTAAARTIEVLKEKRPELLLGAGTILSIDQLELAQNSGALFAVSPGLDPKIVRKSVKMHFPFFPGILTPSEVGRGLSLGNRIFKFFPSEAGGGVAMLKAVSAPYAHLKVRFMPTGGITYSNMDAYLALPQVLAIGGTWIAGKDLILAGKWKEIKKNAAKVVQRVQIIRG